MSRILIAGCGYVGGALAERLALAGHTVWGLRRNETRLPPGVQFLRADLSRPDAIPAFPPDLEYVVFSAGADETSPPAYRALYVQGLSNLLAALEKQAQKIKRVLFTSSTSVYGQSTGEWVDESSETCPTGFPGQILLEAEFGLFTGPFEGVVLRLGGLYGPGRAQLADRVRKGKAGLRAGPPQWTNRIHRDDAAGAIAHLLFLKNCAPVYLGVDHEPAERNEVLRWLAARLGVRLPEASSPEQDNLRGGNKRCSNARLRTSGYQFQYPTFREGYGTLLADK